MRKTDERSQKDSTHIVPITDIFHQYLLVEKRQMIVLTHGDSLKELTVIRYAIELIKADVSFNIGAWLGPEGYWFSFIKA